MTFEIFLVLALLAATVVLFVIERPRADVVALLLLGSLAITGLVEPREAISGFSSPAVITVWAVFILSGGLSKTGIANVLGRQVLRVSGAGEIRLTVIIMLVSAVLSAFMNNVGATALLLPVVMDIARRTEIPPSKLLIPLSFSSLLGGMLTLIGTPPNILIAEAVRDAGGERLGMFSFTPVGLAVLLAGIAYMALIGRHLLPSRDLALASPGRGGEDLRGIFGLHKRLLIVQVPTGSPLDGRTVAECRIQPALGLTVIGIVRGGQTRLAPAPNDLLQAGDRLLVEGRPSRLEELRESPALSLGQESLSLEEAVTADMGLSAVRVEDGSELVGRTLQELEFRRNYGGVVVLAVRRGARLEHSHLEDLALAEGDVLLLQATAMEAARLVAGGDFAQATVEEAGASDLDRDLMRLMLPGDSFLVGRTLAESRLDRAFGLTVLTLVRGDTEIPRPEPDTVFEPGDSLIVKGDPDDLDVIRGLQGLQVERRVEQSVEELESDRVGLAVVAIAPTARIARRSLRDLRFRERYGLSVLALWRQGRVIRTGVGDQRLVFGDALLLHGSRDRLSLLASDPDFLILTEGMQEAPKTERAPWALAAMGFVLAATIAGFLPIYVAAVIGATLMIVTGCLSIDDAYREIEWRAVFLIAAMLPLGIAMEKTGTALFLTEGVVDLVGDSGPMAILGGIFLLAMIGAQIMPTAAVALLLAPIAIQVAESVELSPMSLVMAIAVGASTSFISPVTHPANVLVMGPGGYRFIDYVKVGLPLALITLLVVLAVVPLVWPFEG